MPLSITLFTIGPLGNNTYLLHDTDTHQGVVIDPSFGSSSVCDEASRMGITISAVWLTHAHFDHTAGVAEIAACSKSNVTVGIHKYDLDLYHQGGNAVNFGLEIEIGPEPALFFEHRQVLNIGSNELEVLHTPGHTPGHVVFYSKEENLVICGDLIFRNGVGRTDLPGGSFSELANSIQTRIFTLPPETRLLSGHGPETTVGDEQNGLSSYY